MEGRWSDMEGRVNCHPFATDTEVEGDTTPKSLPEAVGGRRWVVGGGWWVVGTVKKKADLGWLGLIGGTWLANCRRSWQCIVGARILQKAWLAH
jgi:hypothetical protein